MSASVLLLWMGLETTFEATGAAAQARPAQRRVVSQKQGDKGRSAKQSTQKAKPETGGAMGVFSDFEKAWNSGNVDLILKHYPEGKVAIAIEGSGPTGGKFSRNQSYYLLKDLFKYTITRKFEFVQFRKPEDNGTTSFAIAERRYQRNDDGRLFKDKIYVSLHLQSGRWVVDEIKSIR